MMRMMYQRGRNRRFELLQREPRSDSISCHTVRYLLADVLGSCCMFDCDKVSEEGASETSTDERLVCVKKLLYQTKVKNENLEDSR